MPRKNRDDSELEAQRFESRRRRHDEDEERGRSSGSRQRSSGERSDRDRDDEDERRGWRDPGEAGTFGWDEERGSRRRNRSGESGDEPGASPRFGQARRGEDFED